MAILAHVPVPHVRKISETIADFGEPLLRDLESSHPPEAARAAFELVIAVWNAHVMAMSRWGRPQPLAELHQRMQAGQMPAETVEIIRTLSQRRLERFATDGRAVGEWSVVCEGGAWRLRCDARVPNNR